jgi:UPF0716 protein FxsA
MNVAIWLLLAILALPAAEIVVFVLVALKTGFGPALLAVLATSFAGALMLRYAGTKKMSGIRVVLGPQRVTALEAHSAGTMILISGILLLIPGFITDAIGLLLLVVPLRRAIATLILRKMRPQAAADDGVVDLDREEWRRMPQDRLANRPESRPRSEEP